jgi:hypothetical protein
MIYSLKEIDTNNWKIFQVSLFLKKKDAKRVNILHI